MELFKIIDFHRIFHEKNSIQLGHPAFAGHQRRGGLDMGSGLAPTAAGMADAAGRGVEFGVTLR